MALGKGSKSRLGLHNRAVFCSLGDSKKIFSNNGRCHDKASILLGSKLYLLY